MMISVSPPTNEPGAVGGSDSLTSLGVVDDTAPLSLSLATAAHSSTGDSAYLQVITTSDLASYPSLQGLIDAYVRKHPHQAGQFNPEGQILMINRPLIRILDQVIYSLKERYSEGELVNIFRIMLGTLHVNLFYSISDPDILQELLEEYFMALPLIDTKAFRDVAHHPTFS